MAKVLIANVVLILKMAFDSVMAGRLADAVEGLGSKHLCINGNNSTKLSTSPAGSEVWPVSKLRTFGSDAGGKVDDLFYLLPKKWTSCVFHEGFDIYYAACDNILLAHPKLTIRGKTRAPVYENKSEATYVTLGTSASRNSRGLKPIMRNVPEMVRDREDLDTLFRRVEHCVQSYLDSRSISILQASKRVSGYSGFHYADGRESNIWSAVALSKNACLNRHTDPDFFLGALVVLSDSTEDEILQYFCFPSKGPAVTLRKGSILLFNPTEDHCVSSRVDTTRNVIIASFYLKTAVVGGNDNSRSVLDLPVTI